MALLETAADRRETLLRQIYEVNRADGGGRQERRSRGDPRSRSTASTTRARRGISSRSCRWPASTSTGRRRAFEADGVRYGAGTFVVPMAQVFARYARDILETADLSGGPARTECAAGAALRRQRLVARHADRRRARRRASTAAGDASRWRSSARRRPSREESKAAGRASRSTTAVRTPRSPSTGCSQHGATVSIDTARDGGPRRSGGSSSPALRAARSTRSPPSSGSPSGRAPQAGGGVAHPGAAHRRCTTWNGGNMDEGWTRWVLEQYGFRSTRLHNADVRAGGLSARSTTRSSCRIRASARSSKGIRRARPVPNIAAASATRAWRRCKQFVNAGGTLITLGAACDLAIAKFPVPVRNLKSGLTRDQHFAPGTILRVEVDTRHPIGYGMAADNARLLHEQPVLLAGRGLRVAAGDRGGALSEHRRAGVGLAARRELMAGRAAVVSIDMNPGPHRPVRPAPAASRADPRDVPDAVQRAVPVDDERGFVAGPRLPRRRRVK